MVEGVVTQVTTEPGKVRLSLTWPNLSPVTFRGEIAHQNGFSIIRPSVSLEVDNTEYSIKGEVCVSNCVCAKVSSARVCIGVGHSFS